MIEIPDKAKLIRELSAPIADWLMDVLEDFDKRLQKLETKPKKKTRKKKNTTKQLNKDREY